jgi:hypothetical protein
MASSPSASSERRTCPSADIRFFVELEKRVISSWAGCNFRTPFVSSSIFEHGTPSNAFVVGEVEYLFNLPPSDVCKVGCGCKIFGPMRRLLTDNTRSNTTTPTSLSENLMFKRLAVQIWPKAPFLVPRSVLKNLRPASRCLHTKKVSSRERYKKFTAPSQRSERSSNPQLSVCP